MIHLNLKCSYILKILKLPVSANRGLGISAQSVTVENKCWLNYFKINSL